MLDGLWRWALALLGLALIGVGLWWWYAPPEHTAFAPQATARTATAKVGNPSETFSGVLLGIGAVLVLVAANGRKLTSVKVGDNELAFAQAVSEAAGGKAKDRAKSEKLTPDQQAAAVALARSQAFAAVMKAQTAEQALAIDIDHIANQAVTVAAKTPPS